MYTAMNNRLYKLEQRKVEYLEERKGNEGEFGAQNRIRTCTPLRALPPQSSVSTNFTIWAGEVSTLVPKGKLNLLKRGESI